MLHPIAQRQIQHPVRPEPQPAAEMPPARLRQVEDDQLFRGHGQPVRDGEARQTDVVHACLAAAVHLPVGSPPVDVEERERPELRVERRAEHPRFALAAVGAADQVEHRPRLRLVRGVDLDGAAPIDDGQSAARPREQLDRLIEEASAQGVSIAADRAVRPRAGGVGLADPICTIGTIGPARVSADARYGSCVGGGGIGRAAGTGDGQRERCEHGKRPSQHRSPIHPPSA